MNKVKPTKKPVYRSALRQEQAELTRKRICAATAGLLEEGGAPESITFKAVAERAGVTEMTVYRHFPNRQDLLTGLWAHLNATMSPGIGMPASVQQLRNQHAALYEGFDTIPTQIIASVTTPQGREMRSALNDNRREAFLAIVAEVAPDLGRADKTQTAAVLQLLHSAYAWISLREQWHLSGRQAGKATLWAIETLLQNLKNQNAKGSKK